VSVRRRPASRNTLFQLWQESEDGAIQGGRQTVLSGRRPIFPDVTASANRDWRPEKRAAPIGNRSSASPVLAFPPERRIPGLSVDRGVGIRSCLATSRQMKPTVLATPPGAIYGSR